ncbi:MAG: hypothetical protein KDC70_00120 [Saprospiraceae bacterium]|nr:hypothetical protein [Saprospiraceae bacterium]
MEAQRNNAVTVLLRYAKQFFLWSDPHRGLQVFYNLSKDDPHLIAWHRGAKYHINSDGQTFFLLGEMKVPAPGCPFPRELATLNAAIGFNRAMRWAPPFLLFVSAWTVGQLFMWSMPGAPVDEFRFGFISVISFWVNAVLVVGFALCVLAAILWNFGQGVSVRLTDGQRDAKELSAGVPDIAPDIFVMSESADEGADKFAERMGQARGGQLTGAWVVVIAYRHPTGLILTGQSGSDGNTDYLFNRDTPDYQGKDWPDDQKIVQHGFRFERETWSEYLAYCHTFASHYREWAKAEKVIHSKNPIRSYTQAMQARSVDVEF